MLEDVILETLLRDHVDRFSLHNDREGKTAAAINHHLTENLSK
jgi:hypothetical protein